MSRPTEKVHNLWHIRHRQRRAQLTCSGLKDRLAQYLEARLSECLDKPSLDREVPVGNDPATMSVLRDKINDELEFRAIANKAPHPLFNYFIRLDCTRYQEKRTHAICCSFGCGLTLPDFGRFDRWPSQVRVLLRECDKDLRLTCGFNSRETLPGLMVIDCFSRRVVVAGPRCDYVALSYVWGSIASRGEDESFQSDLHGRHLPQTVQDAMNVVRVLGMRFLWVDRYCINGTQSGMKHYTISNMDTIYEAAYLTIIAASGSDGDHGLPRVSGPHVVKVLGEDSIPPWNGIVDMELSSRRLEQIESSTWSTRGWTYQEGLLSPRHLIFTETCAIVHYRGGDSVRTSTGIFAHINEYSRRCLTYPSDTLNAFLGVLRAYERLRPPAMHVWGVPFLVGDHGGIRQPGYGLLWGPYDGCSLRRIQGLPSWTWAGWSGWSARDVVLSNRNLKSEYFQLGPYHWLVSKASLDGIQSWEPSDISIKILVGSYLADISTYFRYYRLPSGDSEEPAPILYLTAWVTTVTVFVSPTLDVHIPGLVMPVVTLVSTADCMSKGGPRVNGCLSCEWTAAVICWGTADTDVRALRTQSLLLEPVGEDTFHRVGVLETDWQRPGPGEDSHTAEVWPTFTRTCLRIE